MPIPAMDGIAARDGMPRPGGTFSATARRDDEASGELSPRDMPNPSFANSMYGDSEASGTGDGPGLPRFGSPGGQQAPPSYEPGVVEVLFREGVSPGVIAGGTASPGEIRSPSAALDDVNRILERYHVKRIEPTFHLDHESATTAQSVARDQGIDVPHLAHFVTLRFPAGSDVQAIARELSDLADVEKAVPVPIALPPSIALAPPPRIAAAFDLASVEVPERWRDLWRQRLRWSRGMIETLRTHGAGWAAGRAALAVFTVECVLCAAWALLLAGTLVVDVAGLLSAPSFAPGFWHLLAFGLFLCQTLTATLFDAHYARLRWRSLILAPLYPLYFLILTLPTSLAGWMRGAMAPSGGRWQRTARTASSCAAL